MCSHSIHLSAIVEEVIGIVASSDIFIVYDLLSTMNDFHEPFSAIRYLSIGNGEFREILPSECI